MAWCYRSENTGGTVSTDARRQPLQLSYHLRHDIACTGYRNSMMNKANIIREFAITKDVRENSKIFALGLLA